jgi:hypothetical protein
MVAAESEADDVQGCARRERARGAFADPACLLCRLPGPGGGESDAATEAVTVGNVLGGILKLSTVTGDGREQIVGIVYPADFIGRPFGKDSPHSITALTDSALCIFGRTAFDRFAREHEGIGHQLLERTLTELDRARHWMLLLGRKSASERVASLLVEIADRVGGGDVVELPLSRQQMADVLDPAQARRRHRPARPPPAQHPPARTAPRARRRLITGRTTIARIFGV